MSIVARLNSSSQNLLRNFARCCIAAAILLIPLTRDCRAAADHVCASNTNQSIERETITIQAVLNRCNQTVESVRWRGPDELIALFRRGKAKESTIRTIDLKQGVGPAVTKALHFSVSPDGKLLLAHTAEGWLVRDFSGAVKIRLGGADGAQRRFNYCCPSAWSADSRYAALAECQNHVPATVRPASGVDVPIVDIGETTGNKSRRQSRVTIIDVAHGSILKRIWLDDTLLGMAWDTTNRLFVSTSGLRSGQPSTAVLQIEPASQKIATVFRSLGRFQSMVPAPHPGGDFLALVFDVDNRTWDDFNSVLLIDVDTGDEMRRLTRHIPVKGKDYVWSPAGQEIYARVGYGGLDQIFAISTVGSARRLTSGKRRHFDLQISPNGDRLSYQTLDGYGRHDIRTFNLQTGIEDIVLVVDDPREEFKLGEWQHVRWKSTDGVRPFGYLVTPPGFDDSRQYPMIVDVHGGGEGSRLYLQAPFTGGIAPGPLEWHAWAALGYVVFVPDYRSTGDYGPKVISTRYRAGRLAALDDIDDIVSGTRFVSSQGYIDAKRIAIIGHSAGGQRVYVLLAKHDLYSAAVIVEPIPPDPASLFISMASGVNTGGYPADIFKQMYGGRIDQVPDRYKANYMFDSYRVKTPTLIMLGNEHLGGVDPMPSEVLYSILREDNVPTKLLKFTEEGHNYSSPDAAILAFQEARRWLDMHLP